MTRRGSIALEDRDAIETLIRATSLAEALGAIVTICDDQAEFERRCNDKTNAKLWDRAATVVLQCATSPHIEGL